MKILFIAVYNDFTFRRREEIGVCYISAYLKEKGYESKVISNRHTGFDMQEIIDYQPDLVGFPVYSANKVDVLTFCRKIKNKLPNVKIVLGGYLPTYYGKELMEEEICVDFITRGEGELVTLQLVRALETGGDFKDIKALTYRLNGSVIENKGRVFIDDLDGLPFPSRELLSKEHSDFAVIQSSRGCKGRCTFCACPDFWTDKERNCSFRGRSIDNVVKEIEQIVENTGITAFMITDQSFEDSPDHDFNKVEQFAQAILNKKLKITYHISFRATFHKYLNDRMIQLLKDSGLVNIFVGFEAFNTKDLVLYGKMATLNDNLAMLEILQNSNIPVGVGFINLNPYTDIQSLKLNLSALKKYHICSLYMISTRIAVFKGTRMYHMLERDNLLVSYVDQYDKFDYRFVNPEIGIFADFLDDQLSKKQSQVNSMTYFQNDFMVYFSHLKNRVKNYGNEEIFTNLCLFEQKFKNIFYEMSDRCSLYFENIYVLIETGWDYKSAAAFLSEYLQYEEQVVKKLKTLEFQLYRILVKNALQEEIPKY